MTVSFLLVLYFNTLHVRFHVDGLEGHQQHLQRAYALAIISGCGDKLVDHEEQHRLHQITLQQQQIYSLSF
jgi:hypothetical protein